jgi:hypothetical protein
MSAVIEDDTNFVPFKHHQAELTSFQFLKSTDDHDYHNVKNCEIN